MYTEYDTADGAKHEHESDSPRDLGCRLIELFRELFDGQGNSEEVKGIP